MPETHVCDCTGPDMRCPCGFKFTVARFAVSLSVYDNETKETLVSDAFNTDSSVRIAAVLAVAARKVRLAEKLEQQ